MSAQDNRIGRYIETLTGGEVVRAYVPKPLPPVPPIRVHELLSQLSAADQAVGRLDGISTFLPDKSLFLYMYVRKEAVLSSQIEGTQSTLDDLLRFEALAEQGTPIDDIREVSNYVDAMMHGLDRLPTSAALASPDTRDARTTAAKRSRQNQEPRRIPKVTELDRRHSTK